MRASRAIAPWILLAAVLFGCRDDNLTARQVTFLSAASSVEEATTLGGAERVAQTEPAFSSFSAERTWRVETAASWDQYREEVTRVLVLRGFRAVEADATHARFTRSEEGEQHFLDIFVVRSAPKLQVRVAYRVLAS